MTIRIQPESIYGREHRQHVIPRMSRWNSRLVPSYYNHIIMPAIVAFIQYVSTR